MGGKDRHEDIGNQGFGYIRPVGPDKNSDFNVSAGDSDCKGINDFI